MKDNPDRSSGEDGALENGLPQPFVESMRTLFDILDDQHTGRVRFSDIERRWHEDEDCTTSGLPPGVLESLRVVTPQDGYLSFSRFCKGLQICLLRSKSGNPGLTPTSLASSAQSSPSSGGETSRSSDHQRTSGSRREEVPPPIPPPPSHQAYQAPPPPLPYISHSGSLKNPDFNGNRKVSNHTSAGGWLSQKTKSGPPPPPVGLYSGGNVYDMKKSSIDGSIYQQHFSLSNNKYHLNGFSHHGDGGRENRNNNVSSSTQIQSSNFPVSGNNIRSAPSNSPLKNDPKGSSGCSLPINGDASSNSRSGFGGQAQKSDIRMGTGGMMSVYGGKVTSSSNSYSKLHGNASSQGPPKPPRSLESQTSDNFNSADKFNGKPNGSLNHQVGQSNSSHRVDSIINKMEALSSYASSANTNNSNIHKEKIYDSIANKSRQGAAPVTNGFYTTSNTKSSSSSNQTHPYRKESSQTRPDDAQYDHWSSDRIKRGSSKPSGSSSSSNNNRAPAALPLSAVLNGYSLQRSQTHSHITTHSLERDSRADARRVSQDANPAPRVRTRRGGSLERLLDDHNSHNQHQYFHHHHHHHHNGGVARHHHHSRESSNDTSSTAPLHSYHSSADWSVGASHAPSSTSLTSTSSSTNNWNAAPPSMPSKNNAAGGSMATFSQRFQHQPQKGAPQYPPQQAARKSSHQSSSPTKSGNNPTTGGSFVTNLGPNTSHKSSSAAVKYNMVTGNTSGSSAEVSPRRSSTEARHSSNMGVRSGNGSACASSSAAPVDNRLLMNSYAWIRGGEDTSSNNGDGGYHSSNANFGVTGGAAPVPPPPTVPLPPENEDVSVAGGGSSGEGVPGGANGSRGHKKSRRRDARRHTLQNGLDYAVVRRAGELEAERDMLHQGLQVVEQARQWYRTQLHNLLYNLHHNTHSVQPYDSEAQQQKLHYQLARITEINSQLTALMSASDMPHHLALASSTGAAPTGGLLPAADASADKQDKSKMQGQVKRLKDQNHQLTEEVSMKSQHISVLEQDKSRLLRELFQARTVSAGSLEANGQADSTFM